MTCVVLELVPLRGKNKFKPRPSNQILVPFRPIYMVQFCRMQFFVTPLLASGKTCTYVATIVVILKHVLKSYDDIFSVMCICCKDVGG